MAQQEPLVATPIADTKVSKKPDLALNVLYDFSGNEVALDTEGFNMRKVKAGKVRATEYTPGAKYPYKIRPVGSGDAYGYVAKESLKVIK